MVRAGNIKKLQKPLAGEKLGAEIVKVGGSGRINWRRQESNAGTEVRKKKG